MSSEEEEIEDVLLILSVALYDAQHHMLYNERTGFVSPVIQQFVANHFNSDIEVYDDESIERFFREPSEKGIRELYRAVRKPLNQPLGLSRSLFNAFAVPSVQFACLGNLLVRRYALAFFHLIEQFSLDRKDSLFDQSLSGILSLYEARNERMREPTLLMKQWISVMKQFIDTLDNKTDAILKKRVTALFIEAQRHSQEELNTQWQSLFHLHRRLEPLVERMKQLWYNRDADRLAQSVLKLFDTPINQFFRYKESLTFNYVQAFSDSGLLETIDEIERGIHEPLVLSTILFITESSLKPGPKNELYTNRLRFIKTLIDFYKRTHCRLDNVTKTVTFGNSSMYANEALRLWVKSNDIPSLLVTLIEVAFPVTGLSRVYSLDTVSSRSSTTIAVPREGIYTIVYEANTVSPKSTPVVNLIIHEDNEPIPITPVTTPVQKERTIIEEPRLIDVRKFGRIEDPEEIQPDPDLIDNVIAFLWTDESGNRIRVNNGDYSHFVSLPEFTVLCNLAFEYNSSDTDKWLTDENIRFALGPIGAKNNKLCVVDSTVILNYCFGGIPVPVAGNENNNERARNITLPDEVFLPDVVVIIPVIDSEKHYETSHWTTLILYNEKAYYVDSLVYSKSQRMAEIYYKKIRADPRNKTLLQREREEEIRLIRVKNQEYGWECGYYVITIAKWLNNFYELATEDMVAFITTLSALNAFSIDRFRADASSMIDDIVSNGIKTSYGVVIEANEMDVEPIIEQVEQVDQVEQVEEESLIPRDMAEDEIQEDVEEIEVENNNPNSQSSQNTVIAFSPAKKRPIPSKMPRYESFVTKYVDIPPREKFHNDADFNRFRDFITEIEEPILAQLVDTYHTRKIGFLLYNAVRAVYDEIPDTFTLDSVHTQLMPLVVKARLSALGIALSDEFYIENHLFGSPRDQKTIDYLDSISRPTSNTDEQQEVREIIRDYGEWSIYQMVGQLDGRSIIGDWRLTAWWINVLKKKLPIEYMKYDVAPQICTKLTPFSMRRVIYLKNVKTYTEVPRYLFADDEQLGSFKSMIDKFESQGITNKYENLLAVPFFKLYNKGYYVGKGTYGFAVMYRFNVNEEDPDDKFKTIQKELQYVVKYQMKSDYTARGPSTQRITGLVKERNTMLTIQKRYRRTEPKFHHHVEVIDYVKFTASVEAQIISKLHNYSKKVEDAIKELKNKQGIRKKEVELDAIVMEFVNNVTLNEFVQFNHADRNSPFNMPLFIHVIVQVAGYLARLYRLCGFVHHDLSSNNILFDRIPSTYVRYLGYNDADGKPLFVLPYVGFIAKVMDLGKSSVMTSANPDSVTNPCFDMENLLLTYLAAILRSIPSSKDKRDEAVTYLRWNPTVVNFIRRLLRSKEQARKDYNVDKSSNVIRRIAYDCYAFIRDALDHICDFKPATRKANFLRSETRKKLVNDNIFKVTVNENQIEQGDALLACIDYVYDKNDLWRTVMPQEYHLNCYERLFAQIREIMPAYSYTEFIKDYDYDDNVQVVKMNDYI